MELVPKFGQIIQDKPNTTAQLLQGSSGARAKILSNFTTRQAYLLQHSYSKVPVELEPKFVQILQLDKPSTKALLLQAPVELEPKLGQILQLDEPNTTAQLLQGSSGARAKIWSNFTTRQAYSLQHSYPQTSVELEPKFGQIIHKTKPMYYNTANPTLQ